LKFQWNSLGNASFFFSPVFKKNSAALPITRTRRYQQSFVLLLLSKGETLSSSRRRKGSGERIHTERTEWSKKASSSDARKKERKKGETHENKKKP
tara:strand:+ start:372 stop:659 length:288 start_codon:yes stop_codon:yes gene_type:complete